MMLIVMTTVCECHLVLYVSYSARAVGRPYQDIRIRHTIILDDPFEDMPGLDRLVLKCPIYRNFEIICLFRIVNLHNNLQLL